MKKYLLILAIALLSVIDIYASTFWEIYVSSPTPINAKKVMIMNYSNPEWSKEIEQVSQDLEMLEIQVLSGDREATNLIFRLREKMSKYGYITEEFDIILGRLIRINTILFLEELNLNRARVKNLDTLLCNLGQTFVDKPQAQSYEIEMRIFSLFWIDRKDLEKVKNECVVILKKHLKEKRGN